jgi:hypothetical protein
VINFTFLDLWTLLLAYGVAFGLMNDKVPVVPGLLRSLPVLVRHKDGGKLSLLKRKSKREDGELTFFERMLICGYCTGFHAGWIAWLLRVAEAGAFPAKGYHNLAGAFICAMASAAFCYALDASVQWLEENTG